MKLKNGVVSRRDWEKLRELWDDLSEEELKRIVEYIFEQQQVGRYPPVNRFLYDMCDSMIYRAINDMAAEKKRRELLNRKYFTARKDEEVAPPPEGFFDELKRIGKNGKDRQDV
jgi:hypothetical protein